MNNKFAIGIVLYEPTDSSISRILTIASIGYKLILLDNSANENNSFTDNENISYNKSCTNVGLSGGITFVAKKALDLGFYSILNFDQDTIFSRKTLVFVEKIIDEYLIQDKLGKNLVCICFRDFDKPSDNNYGSIQDVKYNIEEVIFTINSGSLYLLNNFNYYSWFSEKYFVDGVDYNFCLTSNNHGFKIYECYGAPDLNHSLEQDDITLNFFNFKVKGRKYSLKRNIDFLISHFRLLVQAVINFQFVHFLFIFKSIVIYILAQIFFSLKKYKN